MLSPLATPTATRNVLDQFGLSTKKALGQHFLVNDHILEKIIALSDVRDDDTVLEVGPGIGTLTIPLLKTARHVIAVERDRTLIPVLESTCAPWRDKLDLIEKDALDLMVEDVSAAASGAMPNRFVANLPYAVAATLILDFFERFPTIQSATVMVQREVAERMAARPGTKAYGAYTVKLALLAEPQGSFTVAPGNFFPPPHVESTVIRLDRRRTLPGVEDATRRKTICTIIDAAFATRRKTLMNSWKGYLKPRGSEGKLLLESLSRVCEDLGIDTQQRAESLLPEDFMRIGLLV